MSSTAKKIKGKDRPDVTSGGIDMELRWVAFLVRVEPRPGFHTLCGGVLHNPGEPSGGIDKERTQAVRQMAASGLFASRTDRVRKTGRRGKRFESVSAEENERRAQHSGRNSERERTKGVKWL